jgi:hypothetical protein
MGARGHLRTALSVWVAPLDRVFCPRGRVRMQGGHLRQPDGDALKCRWMIVPTDEADMHKRPVGAAAACGRRRVRPEAIDVS